MLICLFWLLSVAVELFAYDSVTKSRHRTSLITIQDVKGLVGRSITIGTWPALRFFVLKEDHFFLIPLKNVFRSHAEVWGCTYKTRLNCVQIKENKMSPHNFLCTY